jgi:hypothetical protein
VEAAEAVEAGHRGHARLVVQVVAEEVAVWKLSINRSYPKETCTLTGDLLPAAFLVEVAYQSISSPWQ